MRRLQLAPVAQGLSDFEAKVVTARLGADGILWELRGIVDSLYPLGNIDVLVPVDELEVARQCLLAAEHAEPAEPIDGHDHAGPRAATAPAVPAAAEEPGEARHGGSGPTLGSRRRLITAAVIAGVVAFSITRILAAITWLERMGSDGCSAQAAAEGLATHCRR